MRKVIRRAVLSAIAGVLVAAAQGTAHALLCGQTITGTVTMTADLDCSASASTTGLKIASNATLHGNGHKIIGPKAGTCSNGARCALDSECSNGTCYAGTCATHPTIQCKTTSDCPNGESCSEADLFGVQFIGGAGTADFVEVYNYRWGVRVSNGGNNVTDCNLHNNGVQGAQQGYGIDVDTSNNVLTDNYVHDNYDEGIHLGTGASGNTVQDSAGVSSWTGAKAVVENNAVENVYLRTAPSNTITNLVIKGAPNAGIYLNDANDNTISNVTISSSTGNCIQFAGASDGNSISNGAHATEGCPTYVKQGSSGTNAYNGPIPCARISVTSGTLDVTPACCMNGCC